MKFKKKHYVLIVTLFIFFILAIGITSATEVNNQTSTIIKSNQTSSANDLVQGEIKDISTKHYNQAVKTSNDYIYVNSEADGTYNGTTKSKPTTLSNAIESANDNQTIYLTTNANQDTYIFTDEIKLYSNNDRHNLTIMGEANKTIIFDGSISRFFYVNGISLTLKNIKFTNINENNGAIYAYRSDITLDNCTIDNNNQKIYSDILDMYSSNLIINNSIIKNNKVKESHSVIYQSNGKLTVKNSIFQNNIMENKAPISTLTSTNVIQNSQFINSTSQKTASVMYTKNSENTFVNSKFNNSYGKEGGALYLLESSSLIQNCQFINNTSDQLGGAVTQLGNKTLTITKSSFSNNTAKYDGGAVYSIQSSVTVNSTKFIKNSARNGGALYLGNNVNSITLTVSGNSFSNNKATLEGDSIWSNHDITIKNNVFISSRKNNWIKLVENFNNNLDENWWSSNTPDFNVITDGLIPNSWRLMTVTNITSGNINQITVSINKLSNSSTVTTALPSRTAKFTADQGTFNVSSISITDTITNNYTGNSNNINVTIDSQVLTLNNKLDAYISFNNITAYAGDTVQFVIQSNGEINSKVTLKVNNVTLTSNLTKGIATISYTIPTNWKTNNYTTTLTLNSNSKYNGKSIKGYLKLKDKYDNITITPVNSKDLTLLTSNLPAAYDLRNESLVSSVKVQGSSGSCWAFTSIASLESVLLRKTGIEYNLSENNIKNILKKYSIVGDHAGEPNSGNNDFEPIGYLTSWYGPVLEIEDKYDSSSIISPIINSSFHIQDVYIIPERKNVTDNELIKQAVYNYGAVSTGVRLSHTTNSYSTSTDINHGVTIVGWDDNYSRTNFNPNPPGDGAFIIKNSWGTGSGEQGYHYVSYYDTTIGSLCKYNDSLNEQLNYVVLLENHDNYTNIYQYDTVVNALETTSNFVAYKNIYTATKDENIAAFGSYFLQKSYYTLELEVNGERVHTQTGTVTLPGYRTIKLNRYVQVNRGDEFTITLKINRTQTGHQYILVQYSDLYYSPIKNGQSFLAFGDDTEWLDLYDWECVAPLKVYTKDIPSITTDIKLNSNNTFNVTSIIGNVQSNGKLYYLINGEKVLENGKTLLTTVTHDTTVSKIIGEGVYLKNYILTVVYSSENYVYKQNFTVTNNLKNTSIKINKINNSSYTDEVEIKGKITDEKNSPLKSATLKITINNITNLTVTNNTGDFKFTYKSMTVGVNNVTVTYEGSSAYINTSASTTFNVVAKGTVIVVDDVDPVSVGDNVTVSGRFTTVDGVALKNSQVALNINGVRYTVKTDNKGVFNYSYKTVTSGVNNLTVSYGGNSRYMATNTSVTFEVLSRATFISINNIASVSYTDNVTITGRFINAYGVGLRNSRVAVTVNGVKTLVKTDDDGGFVYSIKTNVVGVNNVTVSYGGSSRYDATSTSLNFNVVSKGTVIVVDDVDPVSVGDNVTVSGRFITVDGVALKNSQVAINVSGVRYTVKTDNNGIFSYSYKTSAVGVNNVTVSYGGNSRYGAYSTKLSYIVIK